MTAKVSISRRQLLTGTIATGLLAAALPDATAQARCLTGKQTRKLIKQGKVVRMGKIKRKVESQLKGQLLEAQLCRDGGLRYKLTVLRPNGKIIYPTANAVTGELF